MLHPLQSDAPLIVYIDVKSPYAFIALKPTLALEAELGLQFDFRPLTLDIPSYLGSAEKKKGKVVASQGRSSGTWKIVRYAYRDARRYAERQGYMLKGTEKIWDSSIANIGILWARQQARDLLPAYLNAVYPAFGGANWILKMSLWSKIACARRALTQSALMTFSKGRGGPCMMICKSSFTPMAFMACRLMCLAMIFYLAVSICLMCAGI